MGDRNVLLILADQHTPRVLGAYGNNQVQTPNLDALSADGLRFGAAYCNSPLCAPSRASLATGRYVHQLATWDNAAPYTGAQAASWGALATRHGVAVTTIGKLHFRNTEDPTGFPDQRLAMHVANGTGDPYPLLRGRMRTNPSERAALLAAGPGECPYDEYDADIAAEAVRYLTHEAPADRPWLLTVSFLRPHDPYVVPQSYWDRYDSDALPLPPAWAPESWPRHPGYELRRRLTDTETGLTEQELRRVLHAYYALVSETDEHVGQVLDALAHRADAGATTVIYTADHGDLLGAHGLWTKMAMYEDSVRVPLIIAGRGVDAGVVDTPVSLVDLYPTIRDLLELPAAAEDTDLPGQTLLAPDDRPVFAELHASYAPSAVYMLRMGSHKLIHHVDGPPQLFDLDDDPDELDDLSGRREHAATLAALTARLEQIVDLSGADRAAKQSQQTRIDRAGGEAALLARGIGVHFTPVP
ncbi:sulfatase-like hydrolase/transferase [Amycolatopsis sp. GM8]|uniref:sulfatase-like hydrolase/transferase n=1 Tax=Amycolatopsis sp. GM8 TaxID=2896530 RepID=UPI001F01EB17|nr:sulfatase-like hydrolase/transferase [Amycolatopsis sp. GM8]